MLRFGGAFRFSSVVAGPFAATSGRGGAACAASTATTFLNANHNSQHPQFALITPQLVNRTHTFLENITSKFRGNQPATTDGAELQHLVYDKERVHYTGKILGISTDSLVFYGKVIVVGLVVYMVLWTFFAGYHYLVSFSLATVGRLGFMAGFLSCAILFSTMLQLRRRYSISPNAVYNQAIATVMRDQKVVEFMGAYPKTGDFRAYCASGGFKLPLLRRIRSGTYELADLLGTKQQRLQMIFILRSNERDRDAMVSCDVRKMHHQIFSSKYQFYSLAVNLRDKKTGETATRIMFGRPEDVIYSGNSPFG